VFVESVDIRASRCAKTIWLVFTLTVFSDMSSTLSTRLVFWKPLTSLSWSYDRNECQFFSICAHLTLVWIALKVEIKFHGFQNRLFTFASSSVGMDWAILQTVYPQVVKHLDLRIQ